MLGGIGNSLVPYSPNKFNTWGRPYAERGACRAGTHVRFAPYLAQAAYGHYFGHPNPFSGYGAARSPYARYSGFGGYAGGYGSHSPRRPRPSPYSGYRMGSPAYRSPHMAYGYGMRPRSSYERPSWNASYRRRRSLRRGQPARRYDTYPTQWYDNEFSDQEDDYYDDDVYGESDYEDTDYRSGYGRQRRYGANYEDSEDDDDDDDDDLESYDYDYDYDDEDDDDYEYDQYDEYSSHPYHGYQQRRGRHGW